MSILVIDKINFCLYLIQNIFIHIINTNFLYFVLKFFYIQHIYKSICGIYKLSLSGIDEHKFVYIIQEFFYISYRQMFSLYCVQTTFPYAIQINILLSLPDTYNLSIPHIDKIIFVYIAQDFFIYMMQTKYNSVYSVHAIYC